MPADAEQEKERQMNKTQTPAAEPQQKSLAAQIVDAVRLVIGKATTTRTSETVYNSTSRTVDTVTDDGQPAAQDAGSTVVVISDAVQHTSPEAAAGPAAAAKAQPQPDPVDLAKEIGTALDPLVAAVSQLDSRIAAVEKRAAVSQKVKSMPHFVSVESNSGEKFPEFAKFLAQVSGLTPGQKLTKATLTTSGWSYGLSLEEADRFLDYVIDESVLLKQIRTVRMTAAKHRIDKIGLGDRVLRKGQPGVDPGDTVAVPAPTAIELVASEVVGIVSVSDDLIEDNIEGEAFVQHLLGMIGRAAANEIEQAAIHGDTGAADPTGILDRWDGFYKLAKAGGAHVIEAMADTDRYWPGTNGGKATRLLKTLPTKYRQDYRTLAVLLHNDLYLDYMDELASKGYSEAWQAITGMQDVPIRSIRNIRVPLLKTDMAFTYNSQNYTDGTFVMVTDLRNLIVGIQREIRIEPQRWARKRCTDWVISMRADVKIENADAIAIYDHAKVK
jgi:HK97 family phage major capsid protein